MHPLAARRARAYALDCLTFLGVAAATIPLGAVVRRVSDRQKPSRGLVLGISAIPPFVAMAWAALAESGPRRATLGKRREGLEVVTASGERIALSRALVRNAVKIFIPWQLGHVTGIGAAYGGFDEQDPLTIGSALATYPLLGWFAWSVLRGDGRGPHDRVADTRVVSAAH